MAVVWVLSSGRLCTPADGSFGKSRRKPLLRQSARRLSRCIREAAQIGALYGHKQSAGACGIWVCFDTLLVITAEERGLAAVATDVTMVAHVVTNPHTSQR